MAYVKRIIEGGNVRIVRKHFSTRYGRRGVPRGMKINPTPEKQKERNKRRAEEYQSMFIPANFDIGDYYFTLTYSTDNRPSEFKEAHGNMTKYLHKVQRIMKRNGVVIKIFAKTEMTPTGSFHHHIIMSGGISMGILWDKWVFGNIKDFQKIYSIDDMKLANYIVKGEGAKHKVAAGKIFKTKNLVKPRVETEIVKSSSWTPNPKDTKDYNVVIDSVYDYDDIYTGFPAQFYIMVKKPEYREQSYGGST